MDEGGWVLFKGEEVNIFKDKGRPTHRFKNIKIKL